MGDATLILTLFGVDPKVGRTCIEDYIEGVFGLPEGNGTDVLENLGYGDFLEGFFTWVFLKLYKEIFCMRISEFEAALNLRSVESMMFFS